MNNNQLASIGFILSCVLLSALTQSLGAYLCLAVSISLFGFILWLDRNKLDRMAEFEGKLQRLSERVDLQSLGRGR